jgi:hypothetical protein
MASYSIGSSWVLVASAVMVLGTPVSFIVSISVLYTALRKGPSRRQRQFAIAAIVLAIVVIGAAVTLVRPWRSSPTMIQTADLFFIAGWVFSLAAPIYVLSRSSVER